MATLTITPVAVAENMDEATVATLALTDNAGTNYSFSLHDADGESLDAILWVDGGNIKLKDGVSFDFEDFNLGDITVTFVNEDDAEDTGTATFTVTDVTLVSVDVAPATGTLPVGYTLRYRATARYSDLTTRDVTAEVTWQSSTPAAATISNALGAQGLATGVAAGETAITATLPGVTGAATLTVTEETLASIAVEPNPFSVAVGGKQQLIATGTFSLGTALDVTRSCTWSTSANRIARVSQGGLASGIAAGEVTITAKKKTRSVVTQGSAAGTVY